MTINAFAIEGGRMTDEQEKVIIALKKCDDGDCDASFFRMAQWVIADRNAVLEEYKKSLKGVTFVDDATFRRLTE